MDRAGYGSELEPVDRIVYEYHLHPLDGVQGRAPVQKLLDDLGTEGWDVFHVSLHNLWCKRVKGLLNAQ